MEFVARYASAVAGWLWPPRCPSCDRRAESAAEHFCDSCWSRLRPHGAFHEPALGLGLAAYLVDPLFLDILTTSKYRRFRRVGLRLSREAARALPRIPFATFVPVPLDASKRRERGFNQTEDFARELSTEFACPVRKDLLARRRGGRALAGRSRAERAAAIRGVFTAAPEAAGEPLWIVDDIVTTGATATECARALRSAGGVVLGVVAMGRALAPDADAIVPGTDLLERL